MNKPATSLFPCILIAACLCAARANDDSAPAAGKTDSPVDIALFANGDTLRGSLGGFDKDGLHWQTVYEKSPVVLTTKFLTEIRLHTRALPENAHMAANEIIFSNGDVLPGTVVSFDGKSFLVDTWYAGRLTIPRAAVHSITASAIVYEGPADLKGWVLESTPANDNKWTCVDGVLSNAGYGAIGRDLKLPALARIQFDMNLHAVGGSSANIYICADSPANPGSFYMFQVDFDTSTVGLAHYSRDTTISNIGARVPLDGQLPNSQGWDVTNNWNTAPPLRTDPPSPKASRDDIHFDIRISKDTKTIRLYLDGKLVREDSNLDDLPKMGGCLIFSTPSQASLLHISRIQVGAWSGEPDDAGGDHAASSDDRIDVANGDSLHGKLKEIANGKLKLVSPVGELEIPLTALESIRLATDAAGPPKIQAGDIRAHLLGHGKVTVQIESWDAKQVVAASPDFGKATFISDAFEKLQFNLDQVHAEPTPVPGQDQQLDEYLKSTIQQNGIPLIPPGQK